MAVRLTWNPKKAKVPKEGHSSSDGLKKGAFKGDVEVEVDLDSYFGCLKGVSIPVQVLLNDIEAVIPDFGSSETASPAKQRVFSREPLGQECAFTWTAQ